MHKFIFLIFLYLCFNSYGAVDTLQDSSCLNNVVSSVQSLPNKGKKLFFRSPASLFKKFEYTNHLFNRLGLENHFQGISYFPAKKTFILTGANINDKKGSLFLSNNFGKRITDRIDIEGDNKLWHVGGISQIQNYLLVPIERSKPTPMSEIQFYDFNDFKTPQKLLYSLKISNQKTGSVDMFYSPEEKMSYLFAFDTKSISIFQSKGKMLANSFQPYQKFPSKIYTGSNIKILRQCDGKIYLANMTNTGWVPPIINDDDVLELYEFDLKSLKSKFVLEKKFDCSGYCNFRGAVSLFFENNKLSLFASKMYRNQKTNTIRYAMFE